MRRDAGISKRAKAGTAMPNAPSTEWDVNGWGDPLHPGLRPRHQHRPRRDHLVQDQDGLHVDYRIDSAYRMRWYGGLGARLVDTVAPSVLLPESQPEGLRDPATRLYDCGNWAVSASWTAPKDAVSGIYFARLVRQDPEPEPAPWRADHSLTPPAIRPEAVAHAYGSLGHGRLRIALREPRASHIYFVVRDDAGRTDTLFQTADTTWQAYNRYGGHCTYGRLDPDHPRLRQDRPDARRVGPARDARAGPRPRGSLGRSRAAGLAHRRAADRFFPAAGPGADLGHVARSRGWVRRRGRGVGGRRRDLAPRRGARGVALRMEARRVGHPDDSVPGGRRQRQPRNARRGRHRHRVRDGQGAVVLPSWRQTGLTQRLTELTDFPLTLLNLC